MESFTAFKAKMRDLSLKFAQDVQQKLPECNPMPNDNEYTKYYNTLNIHSLCEYSKFQRAARREGYADEFRYLGNGWNKDAITFTIGFSKNEVSKMVDSLEIFNTETISMEIGKLAESIVTITLTAMSCEYKQGSFCTVIDDNSTENARTNLLENVPILTMIPHIPSMIWAIQKASKIEDWDWEYSFIVSTDWYYPSWTKKQRFLKGSFHASDLDASSPFIFRLPNGIFKPLDRLVSTINVIKTQKARKHFENVSTFEEHEIAVEDLKKKISSSLPLKRKLEDAFGQSEL